MNKNSTPILDGLMKYKEEKIYRFHMPGHYGKLLAPYQILVDNLFALDATEVPGLDNLAEPEGMIRESLENLAQIYGAQKSYLLVNGSTSGIHIAIDALVPDWAMILVARNAHKSIHNIARRKNLEVNYLFPELDPVFGVDSHMELEEVVRAVSMIEKQVEQHVEQMACEKEAAAVGIERLDNMQSAEAQNNMGEHQSVVWQNPIAAVVLTYPNYYGRAYDLPAIYRYLKSKNILLIVDSAHGASFEFSEELPISAVHCSDVCVHSLHKTLPAFTQVSAFHLGHDFPEDKIAAVEEYLKFYLTTSPSYLFILSAELAVHIMNTDGREKLAELRENAAQIRKILAAHLLIDVYGEEVEHAYSDNNGSGENRSDRKNTMDSDLNVGERIDSDSSIWNENRIVNDFGKLLIQTPFAGEELSSLLRKKYRIQCEMTLGNAILFMLGMVHEKEELDYLAESIIAAAEELSEGKKLDTTIENSIAKERVSGERIVEDLSASIDENDNPLENPSVSERLTSRDKTFATKADSSKIDSSKTIQAKQRIFLPKLNRVSREKIEQLKTATVQEICFNNSDEFFLKIEGYDKAAYTLKGENQSTTEESCRMKNESAGTPSSHSLVGKIAAEDFIPYPPGIPIVMKYEILTEEAISMMKYLGKESVRIFCEII